MKKIVCWFKGHKWMKVKEEKDEDNYRSHSHESSLLKNLNRLFKVRYRCRRCGREK